MNRIMRAFKSSLYDPKVGKYKVQTSMGHGKPCEVKWCTEEEFDALCDEADMEYAENTAEVAEESTEEQITMTEE